MARNKEVGLELPCYGRAPVGLISVEDMVGRHISHHCEITRNLGGLPPIIRIIAGRPNGRNQTDMFGLGTTMDRKRQGGTEPFSAGQSGAETSELMRCVTSIGMGNQFVNLRLNSTEHDFKYGTLLFVEPREEAFIAGGRQRNHLLDFGPALRRQRQQHQAII